jgi:phosphoribosylformylglycinamidine synthase I
MRAAVVIFPGSNRERDVCAALARAAGRDPVLVWHRDATLPETDLIVLPGGFAYGDYLRCGAMAAHSPIMREVRERADKGTPVLGICNGFQILTEAGLLPGALLPNRSLRFTCRDIHLRVENNQTIFTCGYSAGETCRCRSRTMTATTRSSGRAATRRWFGWRLAARLWRSPLIARRGIAGPTRCGVGRKPSPRAGAT